MWQLMNLRGNMNKAVTIYLLEGGDKKTGLFFLQNYFNYKRAAIAYRNEFHPTLRVVKFIKESA